MAEKKKNYTLIEQKIMRLLYQTKAPMTTYEIAKESNISFPTAKKYVKNLVKKGVLIEGDDSNATKK